MGHPQIAAFARLAEGSARPTRSIAGQHTQFTRTIHDMAYDPVRDEILVPNFFSFAILTFKGDANGDVAPVRQIIGPRTQLKLPQRLALDAVHGEIFVPQGSSVLVFNRDDNGDVAPKRVLKGPDTRLGASAITIDPVHNLLIVSGGGGGEDGADGGGGGAFAGGGEGGGGGGGRILIFDRMASGNTKPLRVLSGVFPVVRRPQQPAPFLSQRDQGQVPFPLRGQGVPGVPGSIDLRGGLRGECLQL